MKRFFCVVLAPVRAARVTVPNVARVVFVVVAMLAFDIVFPDYNSLVSPSRAETVGSGICRQTVNSTSGVVVTSSSNTCTVRFNSSNTWTAPTGISSINVLVVGGGGGGGGGSRSSSDGDRGSGGGGGGGAINYMSAVSITGGTSFSVTVGAGGSGGSANNDNGGWGSSGSAGGQSSLTASGFSTIAASGGNAGTAQVGTNSRTTSGGDGGGTSSTYSSTTTSRSGGQNDYEGGGGGAGAGANGSNGVDIGGRGGHGGNGGAGYYINPIGTITDYFGGGGGGGATAGDDVNNGSAGSGGSGGGGQGGVNGGAPVAGTANTGGGGGGGGGARMNSSTIVYSAMNGANGGSGTVIVSYTESAPTNTAGSINAAGTEITLTFSEPLSTTTPNASTFAVTNAGISNPVTNVVASGSTLVLTLREPVYKDQSLSVTYTDPTIGDDTNAAQDNAGLDAATFTRSISTTSISADVPRAARLIGLGTQTLVNLNTNGGNIRGITSDGNKVYFRLSNDYTKIWEVDLDTIVESPGSAVTVTPTSWSITNPPSAAESRQLVYSSGCLFVLDASDVLKCIDTATRSASTVTVPSGKAFPAGQGWLTGNIVGFPDGRIGKLGQPGSGGTATTTLLRVYSVSGTGTNATLSWSEDMTLGDISSTWPSDDHGAVSDGTYLYRIRYAVPTSQAGYKVWRLRSGNESVMAFNGDGTGTCAGSGTLCSVAVGLLSNPTFIGRDNYWGRIFVGDYDGSRFYMTEGTTEKITVSYNTLGGTSVASGTTVAGATISTAPATPTKANYTFSGWYTAETGGTEVTFPYTHGRTSNFTLYARWTPNVYTVSYDSQGGSSVDATAWSYGSSLTLPTPTRPGYEFTGWSTTAAGSELVYQTSNPYRNFNNPRTITYDTGYGKGASDRAAQLTSQNTSFNRIRYRMEVKYENVLRYADVSFDAWDGATIASLAIPDMGDTRMIKRNVTNMAVNSNWRGKTNFATGVINGAGKTGHLELWALDYGTATSANPSVGGSGSIYDIDDTQQPGSYGSFQVHNVTDGQVQTVLAWNEHGSPYASPDIGMGNNLTNSNTDWTFSRTSSFGTSNWKMQIFIGDLRQGGSTYTPSNTAPFTLYAQWVPTSSTVTYNYNNADGGNSTSNNLWTTGDSPITLPTPTRTGFVFGGWYSDASFTTSIGAAGASYTPSGSITAYAKWLRVLNVTFDSRQGSAVSGTTTIEEGSVSNAPATPTRTNYDFKGWYTAATGGTQVSFPYTHGRTSDFTLYAQWITNQSGFAITNTPAQLAYQGSVTLGTTGGNGTGGVVFATSSPLVCSVNANTGVVTMLVSSGNCSVVVTKAGDADYYATSATATIPATKAYQAPISVVGSNSGTYGSSVSLSVSGGSTNGLVSWSDNSSPVCTVNTAGVVSITAGSGGNCSITATMAGDNDYLDVVSSTFTITVSKATQAVLTVTSTETTYGEALTLAATGGSGTGAIAWEKVSGNCVVNEAQGIIPDHASNSVGVSCVVRAKRLSDANYLDRFSANTAITISRANQRGFNITSASTFVTGSSLTLTASGGESTGAVTWSLSSGSCTLSGSTLTASRGGISCVVTATKAGDTNYFLTTDSMTIEVDKITQILTFRSSVPSPAVVGSTYTVSVDSSAFLAPTIAVTNQSASVCSISAGVVTFTAVGTCVVSASQSGNDEYSSAAVSQSINVVTAPADTTASAGASTGSTTNNLVSPTTTIAGGNVNTARTPVAATTTTTTTTTLPPDPSRPQMGADGEAPDVEVGEATAMVQGQAVAVRVERDADSVILTLPNNVKVRFGRTQPGADTVAIAADGVLRMYPEESVEVVVTGLVPGTTYTIFMFSEPVELGRGEASADGGVATLARVPKGMSPGDHTIQVNGVGAGGEMVSMSMGFEVLERQDNTLIVVLALSAAVLLALLGGRPIFARRRRTREEY